MPNSDQCPFCASPKIFGGAIKCPERFIFLPHRARNSLWRMMSGAGIEFGPSAHLCAECGMLWSRASRQKVRDFLESYGDKAAQDRLQDPQPEVPPDSDPPPRLPRI
jgi:hypothetical protein